MSRPRLLVVLAAVVAVGAVGGVVGALVHRASDPVADRNVIADGQLCDCGASGRIQLQVSVDSIGPGAYFMLGGERQPHVVDPGVGLRMAATPPYSCADGETHPVHIESNDVHPEDRLTHRAFGGASHGAAWRRIPA